MSKLRRSCVALDVFASCNTRYLDELGVGRLRGAGVRRRRAKLCHESRADRARGAARHTRDVIMRDGDGHDSVLDVTVDGVETGEVTATLGGDSLGVAGITDGTASFAILP